MAKKPEIRMSQGTFAFVAIVVIAVLIGSFTGWLGMGADEALNPQTPTVEEEDEQKPLQLIPAIEKTKLYVSTYDKADYEGEDQKNRISGTGELIKSGVSIDTVTTSTTGAVASTAEFNGGDKVVLLGDSSGYYTKATDKIGVKKSLQPLEVFLMEAGTPSVSIENDNGDSASTMTLSANEVSKRHTLVIERPGDDSAYQFCGVAANFDDEVIEPRVKVVGSYEEGLTVLDEDYDALDSDGYDVVWAFDEVIKDFDELAIDFLVGTEKDVDPAGTNITFEVFDCEENLQNGKVVYTNEDSSDSDVGLPGITAAMTVN